MIDASPYSEPELVETYRRLAVPLQFAAPASDLIAAMRLRPGERVLDVGTGTGVTAIAASRVAGPRGLVVGIDPSRLMLGGFERAGAVHAVAARAPDLPFRDGCFDAVTANFVLTHLPDVAAGLAGMVRVLRPGGRLGVTNWSDRVTPAVEVWKAGVRLFTDAHQLGRSFRAVIPWERWLSDEANLRTALRRAGLEQVAVSRRSYSVTLPVGHYLSMKQASVEGVLLRRRLGDDSWTPFTEYIAGCFRKRFGASVMCLRDAHIATGRAPSQKSHSTLTER